MRIITISREFGSGGRELGKRLADLLKFDYYDKEIIEAAAASKGLDKSYAEAIMENSANKNMLLHFRQSFVGSTMGQMTLQKTQTNLLLEQKKVIEEIAKLGRDCVIIGRNADVFLKAYQPFNLFVCADMQAKIRRCMERAQEEERLTYREIERKIRSVDKSRQQTREIITGSRWGERSGYHLTVNTTDWDIKALVPAVADFVNRWFSQIK